MDIDNVIPPEQSAHTFRLAEEAAPECIEFLRDLVTLPSPSRGERLVCERVMREMEKLGYRDVHLDEMGNVLGRFGSGPRVLAFDAHVDTVGISNPTLWKYDPFRESFREAFSSGVALRIKGRPGVGHPRCRPGGKNRPAR